MTKISPAGEEVQMLAQPQIMEAQSLFGTIWSMWRAVGQTGFWLKQMTVLQSLVLFYLIAPLEGSTAFSDIAKRSTGDLQLDSQCWS